VHTAGVHCTPLTSFPQQGTTPGALFCAWAACTSASRVVMGRHYVGDVLAGVLLGAAELSVLRALTPPVCV
jgi:membrane-associated phospholipid phosphatase